MCERAWADVLLGVSEEVVWAGADEVGTAELGIGNGEFGSVDGAGTGHEVVAHELLCRELVDVVFRRRDGAYRAAFSALKPCSTQSACAGKGLEKKFQAKLYEKALEGYCMVGRKERFMRWRRQKLRA